MPEGAGNRGQRSAGRIARGDGDSEADASPLRMLPRGFNDLMEQTARAMVAQLRDWRMPIAVTGRLGRVPEPHANGMVYGATLQDPDAPDQAAPLMISAAMLTAAGVVEGDFATATGTVEGKLFRGLLHPRLHVHALVPAEPVQDQGRRREAASLLGALRRAGGGRRAFPSHAAPSVALIGSASPSAQVREDFKGALRGLSEVSVRDVTVSMHDPAAIAAALQAAREDVVALIRGGGDDRDFMVFEAPEVLAALGECGGFRLLGLGHSGNKTLADCVADHVASTPADAGRFVHDGVMQARRRIQQAEQLDAMRSQVQQANRQLDAMRPQIQQAERQLDALRQQIAAAYAGNAALSRADPTRAARRAKRRTVWVTALCAIALAAAILLLAW